MLWRGPATAANDALAQDKAVLQQQIETLQQQLEQLRHDLAAMQQQMQQMQWSEWVGGQGGEPTDFSGNPNLCLVAVRGRCAQLVDNLQFLFLNVNTGQYIESPVCGRNGSTT